MDQTLLSVTFFDKYRLETQPFTLWNLHLYRSVVFLQYKTSSEVKVWKSFYKLVIFNHTIKYQMFHERI